MIKSQLIKNDEEFGFFGEVILEPNIKDRNLQLAQFQLELASIYEALTNRYSLDEAIETVTDSVEMFLEHHKPA